MKKQEAQELMLKIIKEKGKVSPQDINQASKNKIPLVQIYGIAKELVDEGAIILEQKDDLKTYSLAEGKKKNTPQEKDEKTDEKEHATSQGKPAKTGGRDMTKYKFNGTEYNKGRLAHAIIAAYAKEKKPTLKQALALFPDELVRPWGLIKPVAEAKAMSTKYARFFIKPEEEIKLKDCSICVSNQMTPDRLANILSIAKKELKFSIK